MKKYNFKYKSLSMGGPYSNGLHLLGLILLPVGVFLRYTNQAQAVKEAKLLSTHLEADLTIPFAEEGNGD